MHVFVLIFHLDDQAMLVNCILIETMKISMSSTLTRISLLSTMEIRFVAYISIQPPCVFHFILSWPLVGIDMKFLLLADYTCQSYPRQSETSGSGENIGPDIFCEVGSYKCNFRASFWCLFGLPFLWAPGEFLKIFLGKVLPFSFHD